MFATARHPLAERQQQLGKKSMKHPIIAAVIIISIFLTRCRGSGVDRQSDLDAWVW